MVEYAGALWPLMLLLVPVFGILLDDAVPDWPDTTNDDGTGQTGTSVNVTFVEEMKDSIDALVHSTTNPTVSPEDAINELVTARGNEASLNARINTVIDADGNLITPSTVINTTQLNAAIGSSVNLCKNSTFFLWPAGLTSAPAYWAITNATIVATGVGQGDTTRKVGDQAVALTWTSGTADIKQLILDTTDFAALGHLKDEQHYIAFGMWVKTDTANRGRIYVDDGDTQTSHSYHSGNDAWAWQSINHQISAAATKVEIGLEIAAAGTVYVSGGMACLADGADTEPPMWVPEQLRAGSVTAYLPGNMSTGDGKAYFSFARPTLMRYLTAYVVTTEPTGAGINLSVEKLTAAATYTDALASTAIIAATEGIGGAAINASLTLRSLSGLFATSGNLDAVGNANKLARLNIDQVGSTLPGTDMYVRIDGIQCVHPFEDQLSFGFMGV